MNFTKLTEIALLTLCIWGEARGEGLIGKIAVGCVVRNRVINNHSSYKKEILKPYQFSCFNESDPNYLKIYYIAKKLEGLNSERLEERIKELNKIYYSLYDCYLAASAVMQGIEDVTKGALYYFSKRSKIPYWAKGLIVTEIIGNHIFLA